MKPSPHIVFEDNHLIAAIKKPGQTVQPEPGKPTSLEEEVKTYIKSKYEKPGEVFLGVIHRLDMPVSGIVLFARTSKALARMNEQFQKRQVRKIYEAIVEHIPPHEKELITHWLKRDEQRNFTKAFISETKGADKAQLTYEVINIEGKKTNVRIELHTGRKHQIRAQLSAIGCPIVGDVKYGAAAALPDQSISLKAVELGFVHPVTKEGIIIKI
ncbi:MAG: RluA family pseudouridine synthase [Bacteroidota bacterium]